jgi:hypothetical protein
MSSLVSASDSFTARSLTGRLVTVVEVRDYRGNPLGIPRYFTNDFEPLDRLSDGVFWVRGTGEVLLRVGPCGLFPA